MDATMERSEFKATQTARREPMRVAMLATWLQSFEDCLAAVRTIRLEGSLPVLVRLASQPYPTPAQQAALVEHEVPLISVPDRFAAPETSRDERSALASRAYAQFKRAELSLDEPVSLPASVEKRPTQGRGLTDEERRQWLRAFAAEDFVLTR